MNTNPTEPVAELTPELAQELLAVRRKFDSMTSFRFSKIGDSPADCKAMGEYCAEHGWRDWAAVFERAAGLHLPLSR